MPAVTAIAAAALCCQVALLCGSNSLVDDAALCVRSVPTLQVSLPTQYNGKNQEPVGALSSALARLQVCEPESAAPVVHLHYTL